jgi:hypothetical protein
MRAIAVLAILIPATAARAANFSAAPTGLDINPGTTSRLIDRGVDIGFTFAGKAPDLDAFEK